MILITYFDNVMTWNKSLSLSHPDKQEGDLGREGEGLREEFLELLQVTILSKNPFQVKSKPVDNTIEINSSPSHSISSDGSDICVVSEINSTVITSFQIRKKRRKRNPFLDDEAESDGDDQYEETNEDLDADLEGFIDNSEEESENNFDLRKKVEIELNRVELQKFLESRNNSDLEEMGLSFVYSTVTDLVSWCGKTNI